MNNKNQRKEKNAGLGRSLGELLSDNEELGNVENKVLMHKKDGTTVKASTGTEDYSETETERYTGTDSLVKTGSETDAIDGSTSEEEDVNTTKTGNIFKSPAELMMADRDFWLTDFFSIVFEDVDQMITLAIYPEKTVRHLVLTD